MMFSRKSFYLGSSRSWKYPIVTSNVIVVLKIHVRRFRCTNPICPRSIFCKCLTNVAEPCARSTKRLVHIHLVLGLALGDETGARLVTELGISISADTLLGCVREREIIVNASLRVVEIDDWA